MRSVIAVFCGLWLSSCQNPTPLEELPVQPEPSAEVLVSSPPSSPPSPSPPPEKPRFIVDNIINLAPDTVRTILGQPHLQRSEKDAAVWLYRNSECVMHLYFYPNDNGDFRLDYVETAAVGLSAVNPTVSPNACLDSLIPSKVGP